jgi:hypothetical protein
MKSAGLPVHAPGRGQMSHSTRSESGPRNVVLVWKRSVCSGIRRRLGRRAFSSSSTMRALEASQRRTAGDVAYNDVHLWLGESNAQTRREWISALDTIESLNRRAVIAGHKRPGSDDSPAIIEETRQYVRDFDRVAETTTTAREPGALSGSEQSGAGALDFGARGQGAGEHVCQS